MSMTIADAPEMLAALKTYLCNSHAAASSGDDRFPPLPITEPCRYSTCEPARTAVLKAVCGKD